SVRSAARARRLRTLRGGFRRRLRRARFEREAHLAIGPEHQIRLELAAGARRDEVGEQVGAALGEQLAHLRGRDLLLQDDLAAAEIAALPGTDRVLADVVHPVLEDAAAAFRALAQRFPSREVDRFGLIVVGVGLPEIELQPVLVVQLQDRRERTPEPAAESLQRTDRALAQQLLGLLDVE